MLGRSPPAEIRAGKESAGTISQTDEPIHNEKLVRLKAVYENDSEAEYSWLLAELHDRYHSFQSDASILLNCTMCRVCKCCADLCILGLR